MFRRILFAAVGAIAAISIGAAGAYFTAEVQVADSTIHAGSVAISTVPTTAPLAIDALAPGTTATRNMTVVNDGSLPSDVVLSIQKKAGITDFYNALTVHVTSGDTVLYDGLMSAMKTTPVTLSPGARGDFRFDVGLPPEATNSLAQSYAKVSVYVDAEQTH